MHRHHFYIGLIGLVILGSGTFYILRNGLYPVAMVNGAFIKAANFERTASSAFNFYANAATTYKKDKLTADESDKLFQEVRRAALDRLIEEAVVAKRAEADFGSGVRDAVDKKIAGVDNAKLGEAVQQLYGLSDAEFKTMVLAPAALQEVITERLNAESKNYNAWLDAAKQSAGVHIFLPGFSWANGKVEAK